MDRDATLREVEQRVLWLATSIVHHANRVRPNPDGLKVGGHQASSASLVSIMTELWFNHLRPEDRVSVKPHASPVLHAINYLLGELSAPQLETLRAFGGLQSYPSRAKDPDTVDYSTGSVGIGATAPIWGALARRYVRARAPGASTRSSATPSWTRAPAGRRSSTRWCRTSARSCWIIDLNRQSLDRIVPNIGAVRLAGMFDAAGWQVLTVKYGRLLHELFERPGGDALRRRIDEMENPEYQRLLRCTPDQLRERLPGDDAKLAELVAGLDDATLYAAIRNLGGHDLASLREAFDAIDDTRPTVIFAYTVKGYGLATRGPPAEPLLAAHRRAVGRAGRAGRRVDRAALGPLPGVVGRRGAVPRHRRSPAPPGRHAARRARAAHRHRPHPGRARHHPGRARAHPARPHPHRARRREARRHAGAGRLARRPTSAAG